jgi:hypothetical protein
MVSVQRQPRKWLFILGSAVLAVALLSACGDSTATSIPAAATTAATSAANSGNTNAAPGNNGANPPAGTTPGANGQPGQPGGAPGQGQFGGGGQVISGTLQSYDASTKMLVVKDTAGKTEQLTATNPVLIKNSKLTTDQLGQLLTDTTLVAVQGDKANDGTYTARDVTVMSGNFAGQFGGPGGFGPGQGANGTPGAGANGSPRAGRGAGNNGGTPPANVTPGAGGFRGGQGQGPNGINGVILRGAKFADGKLTGTNPVTGETATVVLTSSTVLTERAFGDVNDLKAGLAVTVRMRPAQNNNPAEATMITYTA